MGIFFRRYFEMNILQRFYFYSNSNKVGVRKYKNYIMTTSQSIVAPKVNGNSIVYTIVCSGSQRRKYQSSVLMGLCEKNHRSLMDSKQGQWCGKRFYVLTSSCNHKINFYIIGYMEQCAIVALRWRHNGRDVRLFTQQFIRAPIKENIKAPRHWPLYGEFTGDRWIPRTNGQ